MSRSHSIEPYQPTNQQQTDLEKIRQIVVSDVSPPDADISVECVDLIHKLLTVDAKKRATIHSVRHHAWTNKGYDEPPMCRVPQTKPVAKVAAHVLKQVMFSCMCACLFNNTCDIHHVYPYSNLLMIIIITYLLTYYFIFKNS